MKFLETNGVDISFSARCKKLREEFYELILKRYSEDDEYILKECADILNVVFSIMDQKKCYDPLFLAFNKLEASREKYIKEKGFAWGDKER